MLLVRQRKGTREKKEENVRRNIFRKLSFNKHITPLIKQMIEKIEN